MIDICFWAWRLVAVEIGAIEKWYYYYYHYYYYHYYYYYHHYYYYYYYYYHYHYYMASPGHNVWVKLCIWITLSNEHGFGIIFAHQGSRVASWVLSFLFQAAAETICLLIHLKIQSLSCGKSVTLSRTQQSGASLHLASSSIEISRGCKFADGVPILADLQYELLQKVHEVSAS